MGVPLRVFEAGLRCDFWQAGELEGVNNEEQLEVVRQDTEFL